VLLSCSSWRGGVDHLASLRPWLQTILAKGVTAVISEQLRHPLALFEVSGRTAVITGASGAFGRAIAIALGACGCRLLLAAGSADPLEAVADEVREVGGSACTFVRRPDSEDDAAAIVAAAYGAYGSAELLVVASGFNKPSLIAEMAYADWQQVMDANVRGPWLMARAFGPALVERGRPGKVLFVSSVRGRHGNAAGHSAYSTSKAAIDGLTRVLATEWAQHRINVNAVAPTVFRSTLTGWIFADDERGRAARERNVARIPLGRLGEPEDLVGIALYLLSPASDFCTGQVVYVDGGFTAG
jgi:NAD(P)-dependent dehydrogenase (short-subunit alcohol dehydrogenase family)